MLPAPDPSEPTGALVCSARGCRARAVWGLRWNNPRLHTPERRKTWLACETHRETLGDFLSLRGFLKDTVPVTALDQPDEPDPPDPAAADTRGSS